MKERSGTVVRVQCHPPHQFPSVFPIGRELCQGWTIVSREEHNGYVTSYLLFQDSAQNPDPFEEVILTIEFGRRPTDT